MWQRIQTVFLVIIIIAQLVSLVQPIWIHTNADSTVVLTPFYFTDGEIYQYIPYSLVAILSIAAATVAFTSIRKFKNRLLQMKLGALISLLLVGVIGGSAYFAIDLIKQFPGGQYSMGMYLPVVSVLCNLLANFFIRKDEKLVKDSERLR